MATFVVCTRCSKTLEIAAIDQFPATWRHAESALLCPHCADADTDGEISDVLEEEVIYPRPGDDTFDESFEEECEVCRGSCQGH